MHWFKFAYNGRDERINLAVCTCVEFGGDGTAKIYDPCKGSNCCYWTVTGDDAKRLRSVMDALEIKAPSL